VIETVHTTLLRDNDPPEGPATREIPTTAPAIIFHEYIQINLPPHLSPFLIPEALTLTSYDVLLITVTRKYSSYNVYPFTPNPLTPKKP